MSDVVKIEELSDKLQQVLVQGDLKNLSSAEKVIYYNTVCKSLGLNPYTRPFDYLILNNRMVLYATRNAADQLRKVYKISVEIVDRKAHDGVLEVHAKAYDETGRKDEDLGVVPFNEKLIGEVRSNQIMKAVTKAKRRVTLSICGLGWLDETEIETIPGARVVTPEALAPEAKEESSADPPSNNRPRTYADRRNPPEPPTTEDWEKRFGPREPGEEG